MQPEKLSWVMQPPWITYPEILPGSIGWRMGRGEDAYNDFYRAFSDLSSDERAEFALRHPEPEGWEGTYLRIAANPWPNG